MRLFVNENLPRQAVDRLRTQGHDVIRIKESAPGMSDRDVLSGAHADSRVLVTMDKDFAALAFRHASPATSGIVLLRVLADDPERLGLALAAAMARPQPWQGHFVSVEPDRIRIRALPSRPRPQ